MELSKLSKGLLLGTASAGALVVALWLTWPKRKVSREDVVVALHSLRAEFAAVCAGVSSVVQRCEPKTLAVAGIDSLKEEEKHDERVRQAIEQPLVSASLHDAMALVASTALNGSADDMEAALQSHKDSEEVEQLTQQVHALHTACLGGAIPDAAGCVATDMWTDDSLIELLRELGLAKAAALREIVPGAKALGPRVVRLCAAAEDKVWERRFPGDRIRRCYFGVGLEARMKDRLFRERRDAVERELERIARETKSSIGVTC